MPRRARLSEEEKLERRRQRCKVNQRRYRANLRESNSLRRVDMEELGHVNRRLEGHIVAIERRGLWCHAEEQSVLEYLRLFEYGYTRSQRQDSFLRYFLDPDGWCNGLSGIEGVMSFWVSYSAMFTYLRNTCVRITPMSSTPEGVLIEVHCAAELGLSMVSIQALFPHVLSRPDLVEKMLRTPLRLPLHVTHLFNENKQVKWQSSDANLVQALLLQFGNLDDVVVAASNSQIQPSGMIQEGRDSPRLW